MRAFGQSFGQTFLAKPFPQQTFLKTAEASNSLFFYSLSVNRSFTAAISPISVGISPMYILNPSKNFAVENVLLDLFLVV